jgi:hypothetical protein
MYPCVYLLLAIAIALPAARAQGCIAVDGTRILARDLAPRNPVFASIDPGLAIAAAPMPGATRIMRPEEIARIARHNGLEPPDSIHSICIERATEPLTAELLRPVVEKALHGEEALASKHRSDWPEPVRAASLAPSITAPSAELPSSKVPALEILDFSRIRIPRLINPGEKDLACRIEFTRAGLSASGMWRGQVLCDDGHSIPVWVKIKSAATSPGNFTAAELGAIERGDRVRVEVHSGAAFLGFEAKAESSGRFGASVLVRNPESGRLFQGRVQGAGSVTVTR